MSDYQGRNGRNNDIIYWLAAIVFLATGIAAPIGFLMIVLKLLGGNRRRRGRHPYYTQQEGQGPMGARTVSTESRNSESVSPGHKRSGRKDASATAQSFIRKLSSKDYYSHGAPGCIELFYTILDRFCFLICGKRGGI